MRHARCNIEHRSYRALANCRWPKAYWISGAGRFAVLAHCRVLTIQLFPTRGAAATAKRMIDGTACGGLCVGNHEAVDLKEKP